MEELSRPATRRGLPEALVERWNGWITWFGFGRLVASAVAVVVVCFGAVWLVRSPPPPTEASLPRATTVPSGATPTLPVATSTPPPADIDDAPPESVTVHVAGAVHRPGVYDLPGGARVDDAIEAAGGATPSGRPGQLNLAAVAVDGSRIHVPVEGEEVEPSPVSAATAADESVPAGPVDLNRADQRLLETLPGIGPATAEAIVVERERGGPFLVIDDLERVPGVGPGKLATIRDLVTV